MSRPLLLCALALVAGIVAADQFFDENGAAVPRWLDAVLWGVCTILTLLAVFDYRRRLRFPYTSTWRFSVLVAGFFFVVGFMRYTMVAEQTQAAWQQMRYPPVNRGNPDELDYRRWRWIQGEPDSTALFTGLRRSASAMREQLMERYRLSGLQDGALAVVAAMTLGDRTLLSAETRDLYAEAGASHLLALSGLHLGILTGLLFLMLTSWFVCSRWRWPVGVFSLFFVWAYVFVAAFPPSLVRAGTMATFFIVATLCRRRTRTTHLLLLTAFFMLLCWPMYLFDVGAQLSFLAVAGIAAFFRPAYRWLFDQDRYLMFRLERWHVNSVLTLLGVSLSAQVFTLPLVMVTFHRIPLYGVFFSLLLIPLTTLLILTALALLVVGGVWLSAGRWLAQALTYLVAAQTWVMQTEVKLPGASIRDFWSRKAEPQLVVYNNRRCPALHLIASPSQSWLLMPQPELADSGLYYIRRDFWQRRLTSEPHVLAGRHVLAVSGMTALMVNSTPAPSSSVNPATAPSASPSVLPATVPSASAEGHPTSAGPAPFPTAVDLLWLTRGFRGARLDILSTLYTPRLLVLDASLPRWQRHALRKEATRMGWPVYDIAEQGALRLAL